MSVHAPEVANRIVLDEKEMPTRWYNIQADLPFPGSPPLHPGTRQPIGPQDLAPLFPMELIKQEVSQERYIDIPLPVQEALRLWRPTPLMRATRLERELTNAGRKIRAEHPDSTGSLGIAISEAVEDAATRDDTKYSLGSVLNHVLMHQTIIGEEALVQMERAGAMPDLVVGCVGGGSNFSGLAFPFLRDRLQGRTKTRFLAAEPDACPSITRGKYTYDFGDTGEMTPLVKMHTLGHGFIPDGIHAGGLRYHGMAPLVSALVDHGFIDAVAYPQRTVFDAAVQFARTEGTIPAPESAHAIRAVIDEANKARERGESPVILFNLSGHGLLDLGAYDAYFAGTLSDVALSEARIQELVGAL